MAEDKTPGIIDRIPYKPITVVDLSNLISKYHNISSYEVAVKLMVDEELLILRKQ